MTAKRLWPLFLACLLALAACDGGSEPVRTVDLSRRANLTAPQAKPALTYAYLPQYAHSVSYARHHLLIQYLARETGLEFRQIFPDTFADHIRLMGEGHMDISFSNPLAYIEMAGQGARAFARILEPSGRPSFQGLIITRQDNTRIRTLKDCRGARWIAVDPFSAGGFLYPLGVFLEHGLSRRDFAEIAFAPGPGGKQEKVVLAVLAGRYDIGSIRDGTLEIMAGKADLSQIRIVAKSRPYPGWMYAAGRDVAQDVVERIARAMFALDLANPEQALILERAGMGGIIPATDQDFDSIRELQSAVEQDRREE